MSEFQAYQAAFTAHLRHPAANVKPVGVNNKRMRVYREIVFTNFHVSVRVCFPVLLDILGKRRFSQLVRQCFSTQHFASPLFRDIPASFVDFVQTLDLSASGLPAFTAQLAHYEWIELALAQQFDSAPPATEPRLTATELSHHFVQLPAVSRLLQYDFPVHQLSRKQQALAPTTTFLLVYRTPAFQIQFIQLNAATYQLLQQLQTHHATVHDHLLQLAPALPPLSPPMLTAFGLQTLHTLYIQQAITIAGH